MIKVFLFLFSPPIDIQSIFLLVLVFLTNINVNNVVRNTDIAVIVILVIIAIIILIIILTIALKIAIIIINTIITRITKIAIFVIFTKITNIIFNTAYTNLAIVARITVIISIIVITNDIEKYYELPIVSKVKIYFYFIQQCSRNGIDFYNRYNVYTRMNLYN